MTSTALPSKSPACSSVSSSLLFNLSRFSRQEYWSGLPLPSPSVFSVQLLYSSTLWVLLGSLLCALSLCWSSLCVLHSSPEFGEHPYDHYVELFIRCITSLYFIRVFFFSFLKFYLVPSFRTFSSISSFCLTLFLLVCKTAISSVLKDSLCLDMALLSFWGKQEFSYFSSSSQSKLLYM